MSWKKYGGKSTFDSQTDIKNHSITTERFSLLGAVYGIFTISGILEVTQNSILRGDLTVGGDASFQQNVYVAKGLKVDGSANFNSDIAMQQTLSVSGNLFLGGNKQNYFYGTDIGVGLNTETPDAALTILSHPGETAALNVYSDASSSRNIISHNNYGTGIVVGSDASSSYIDFFKDSSDNITTEIRSISGGILQISDLNKMEILSTTSICPAISTGDPNAGLTQNINDETLIVYSTFDSSYLYNEYRIPLAKKGNAISAIASDANSNAFLNLTTPGKVGGGIGGGALPYDTARSMLTGGITLASGEYVPNFTIASGIYPNRFRTTMGINTYKTLNDYILDINGPTNMANGESFLSTSNIFPYFHVNKAVFFKKNREIGYASCTNIPTIHTRLDSTTYTTYQYPNLITKNTNGLYWNTNYITESDINGSTSPPGTGGVNINFSAISIYNESTVFLGGTKGYIFYTKNSGNNWTKLLNTDLTINNNITSIYAAGLNANTIRIFCALVNSPGSDISYQNIYIDISSSLTVPTVNGNTQLVNLASLTASSRFDGLVDSSNIWMTAISQNNPYKQSIYRFSVGFPSVIDASYSFTGFNNRPFVDLYVLNNNYVIAITKQDIVSIINGIATVVINTWGTSTNFTYIDCLDTTNNIIYDSSNVPLYTINGASSWKYISYDILNTNGMGDVVFYPQQRLSTILYDINTFVVFNANPDNNGTNIYHSYLPQVFNFGSNYVLNVVGNIQQNGIIHQW
jgi:hypothetical protein